MVNIVLGCDSNGHDDGTTPVKTTLEGQVFRVAVRHTYSDKLTHDEPRFVAKVKVLPDVETASDVLGVRHAKQFMIALLVFGDEFGLVEQGNQVTTRFKIGADIEETAFLVDALGVVDDGISSAEQEVAGVLSLFSLAGFCVKIGLECRVDVGDFYAIEEERRKGLRKTIVGFPVVAVGSR